MSDRYPDLGFERRRLRRWSVTQPAYAIFRPEFEKSGRILDIHKDGLCCEYLHHSRTSEIPADLFEIDIVLSGHSLYLSKLPCTLVYDIERERDMNESGQGPNEIFQCRRCGINFQELSEDHLDNIRFLIRILE